MENCLTRQLGLNAPVAKESGSSSNGKMKFSATVMFHPPAACAKGPSDTHWPKPSPPIDSHSEAVCEGRVQSQ